MTAAELVDQLERAKRNGAGWIARCPAHEDRNPSLSIREGDDGRVLVHCHAGCSVDQITAALGLTLGDLFPDRADDDETWTPHGPAIAVYRYVDEQGRLLSEVCRTADKQFPQRRPDPTAKSGWRWKLDGTRRVLYRLPQLRAAIERGDLVYVVEGEKDVHRLEAEGLVATCNPGGAGKWSSDYTGQLAGAREVVAIADHDEPGIRHARAIASELEHAGIPHRTLVPPDSGDDVSDHLEWHLLDELVPLDEVEPAAEISSTSTATGDDQGRLLRGGAFILDQPADIPAVWRGAAGGGTAWAIGEGLMIVGPDGVGKTSVMQQVALARIGLRELVLGMRLADDERPLLYLALDRPAQIARSFARMVTEEDREVLDRRLIVWKGPPPFDILKQPRALADFAEAQGAGTVVVDSLKDLAPKLSDDEVGGKVNAAFQELLARAIELLCGHHQRKQQAGGGAPKRLQDVYGSRWLTAGMGSVFMLWGDAGDLEVECLHLKQPDEELGPWKLLHDHAAGKTVIADQVNLLELVTARGDDGLTADQAAALIFDSATPARNEVEKARRRLEKLTEQDFLTRTGAKPDPVVYRRKQP